MSPKRDSRRSGIAPRRSRHYHGELTKKREGKFGVKGVTFVNVRVHIWAIIHLKSKAWHIVTFNQIRIF